MPADAVADCSHQGQCDEDVSYWADKIARSEDVTPENLRAELKEYGAWDSDELSNDSDNWQRIVWIAAWIIKERFLIPCKTPLPPKGKTQNENIRNTK